MKPKKYLTLLIAAVFAVLALASCAQGSDDQNAVSDSSDSTQTTTETPAEEPTEAPAEEPTEEPTVVPTETPAEEPTKAPATGSDFPVTIETANGSLTIDKQPSRIVSLSPSATEMLFAIGAGEHVVAVDSYSYFPEEAPVTDLSGWDPNVEAVLGYEPDLVIISNDANDLVASLTEVGVDVLISAAPADLEGGYAELANIGLATGQIDGTAETVAKMRAEASDAFAKAPKESGIRIYHELGDSFYSASSHGFVGSIYAELGASNIADEADADKGGYPQLSEEYIIEADPELIIITDQAGYGPEDVAARPGWENVTAVKNGNIVVVSADVASRWGPRLPQFITLVAQALEKAKAPA